MDSKTQLKGFWAREQQRAAADKDSKPVDRGCLLLLFLPTLSVRTTVTCNKGNNAQTTVDFKFSFCPYPFSGLVCCSFLLLQVADLAAEERDDVCGGGAGERWRTDLAVAGFGLLFWSLLLEAEWRGEMVWSVREEPGYCCDGLCSLAGYTRGEEDAAFGLSGEGEEDVAAVAWRGGCEVC
jgi:hypothetical protein